MNSFCFGQGIRCLRTLVFLSIFSHILLVPPFFPLTSCLSLLSGTLSCICTCILVLSFSIEVIAVVFESHLNPETSDTRSARMMESILILSLKIPYRRRSLKFCRVLPVSGNLNTIQTGISWDLTYKLSVRAWSTCVGFAAPYQNIWAKQVNAVAVDKQDVQ